MRYLKVQTKTPIRKFHVFDNQLPNIERILYPIVSMLFERFSTCATSLKLMELYTKLLFLDNTNERHLTTCMLERVCTLLFNYVIIPLIERRGGLMKTINRNMKTTGISFK